MGNFKVNIKIGSIDLLMNAETEEEEATYRHAGKEIDDRLKQMAKRTTISNPQTLLAMVCFETVIQMLAKTYQTNDKKDKTNEQISTIEHLLKHHNHPIR